MIIILILILWLLPPILWIYFVRKCNSLLKTEWEKRYFYDSLGTFIIYFIPISGYVFLLIEFFCEFYPILKENPNKSFFGIKSINGKTFDFNLYWKKLLKIK